jgi:hypothetical protein
MQSTLSRLHFTVFSVLLCSGAGACLSLLMLGSALAQVKDTSDVAKSSLSMESTPGTMPPVTVSSQRVFVTDFSSLKVSLESQGWTWIDQAGPLARYRKGSQALNVNCGMSSPDYMLCDLTQTR